MDLQIFENHDAPGTIENLDPNLKAAKHRLTPWSKYLGFQRLLIQVADPAALYVGFYFEICQMNRKGTYFIF